MPRKVRTDIRCPKCGASTTQTVGGKILCTNPKCPVVFLRCKAGGGRKIIITSIVEEAVAIARHRGI